MTVRRGQAGRFGIRNIPPGSLRHIRATAAGFSSFELPSYTLAPGEATDDQRSGLQAVDVDPASKAGAIVLSKESLDALFTKPGSEELHGEILFQFSDAALNSRNPFVTEIRSRLRYP